MDKKTKNAVVKAVGTSFINGRLFTMQASGTASVPDGTIEMAWVLSEMPAGFSILGLPASTSSGISPMFAEERSGGKNLLSLSGGNYRLFRTFDYGRHGTYDFDYEITTDGKTVTSTGVQRGLVELPPLASADLSAVEVMYPGGPRELRSFMAMTLTSKSGAPVPLYVSGVYSPLAGDRDWTRKAPIQVRRSVIDIVQEPKAKSIGLRYRTVIAAVTVPTVSP